MPRSLHDLVRFRGDKLFHGAVNIDWFCTDETRSRQAAESFVFHGPEYHGVSQSDVGTTHGHRLVDTANFVRSLVRRCYGLEEEPFTLAIAGYGTGKSHLGLTVANLLSEPRGDTAQTVLSAIEAADAKIGQDVRAIILEADQPCLVVALNGMCSFDLTNEIAQQILRQLATRGLDTGPLDEIRPRFAQAASLVRMANEEVASELLAECDSASADEILAELERQDEAVYRQVYDVFSRRGMPITALGGESIRDIVGTAVREYCGPSKPFHSLLILFDEFGRYTEFATVKSQIAGSGVLQDLFEAIQSNSLGVCFTGFIQFELNAYVQRIPPEYRNEVLRYVTRYQSANRTYLSINMETLVAHLIEKRDPEDLAQRFEKAGSKSASEERMHELGRWFPAARNHRLWTDPKPFHTVVCKGCWPLSPFATWFLFHLAAGGKHLQERSALALLDDAFQRLGDRVVTEDERWSLVPVDFWSEDLQQELITSEEGGQQGAITHAYASVMAKHGGALANDLPRLLQAVVLASKMGLQVAHYEDAVEAISELAGTDRGEAAVSLRLLQEEYNILEWDAAFKQFDILGEAVPRTQFLAWLRQRVASTYDNQGKAKLFASKARHWCESLDDLDCDFAEDNKITTREWRYQAVTASLDDLPMHVRLATDRWQNATAVNEARGTVIYCYVGPDRDSPSLEQEAGRMLRGAAKEAGVSGLPILVVLLSDADGALGQSLAELAVLEESVSEQDRLLFGNLIPAHVERQVAVVKSRIDSLIKMRRYVTPFNEGIDSQRLARAGTELFAKIYTSPVTFPFDGFGTARGNAADTCQQLTRELFLGKLDYDAVMGKPVKDKNRAITVLKDSWGIFGQTGRVLTRPKLRVLRNLTVTWDDRLASGELRLPVARVLQELCQPPYGANIASAGLLLAVFIASRVDKLMVVRDGQHYAVAQWLQDGLFKGKFIDLKAQYGVDLVSIGEESSEWDVLLDEWEQAESHAARIDCHKRAVALKERVPVPPTQQYRVVHLEKQAQSAMAAMAEMERKQNEAFRKLEIGEQRRQLHQTIWGAAQLWKLCDQMRLESPLWDWQEVNRLQQRVELERQGIIQDFSGWLRRQTPENDRPDTVGNFKHRMLHLTGGNLKKLELVAEFEALERHVRQVVRNIENVAEARELVRAVRSWLTSLGGTNQAVRIAESRDRLDVGKHYARKLQGMAQRTSLPELHDTRMQLSEALAGIKAGVDQMVKRASRLWKMKLNTPDDLESCLEEIESLVIAFDGCENDMQDLHVMRRALRTYQDLYKRLNDEHLTWEDFERRAEESQKNASQLIDENDVPWRPADVIDAFVKFVSKARKKGSTEWIESMEQASANVQSLPAVEANRLLERAASPPPILTEPHEKRRQKLVKKIEARLDALKLDWLVEKYKELSDALRKRFLQIIEAL